MEKSCLREKMLNYQLTLTSCAQSKTDKVTLMLQRLLRSLQIQYIIEHYKTFWEITAITTAFFFR